MDVITLTQKLLSFDNTNPPGNEEGIALFVGDLLSDNGFTTEYYYFDEKRVHLVAERGLSDSRPPLVLSGHFDTVPLGNTPWNTDPFTGEVKDGKIRGRGASDMKGALAAMIISSIEAFGEDTPEGGIRIIYSAAEELGCIGIQHLVKILKTPQNASAIIVGEPTSNRPATGHKGALYLKAVFEGRTAHSSMPELGDNAIYKAAKAVLKIRDLDLRTNWDQLLGFPTVNVGLINGGTSINTVPDRAEFTIDLRSTTTTDHKSFLEMLKRETEGEAVFEVLTDLSPVYTPESEPFVKIALEACGIQGPEAKYPLALPYLTDGAVLQRYYENAPTVILGPGEPEMAHQTDEFCYIDKLEESVDIYKKIIKLWSRE